MLILFDQGTPLPIRRYLKGHLVRTAFQQGWQQLVNGDLLAAAERAGFNLILTGDKNMSFQQTVAGKSIAVIVLGKQQWPELKPHIQRVVDAVNLATPGSFLKVEIPSARR